jgi:hypothetical protein
MGMLFKLSVIHVQHQNQNNIHLKGSFVRIDFKTKQQNWVWWFRPIIPAIWKLKQEDQKFEANMHSKTLSQIKNSIQQRVECARFTTNTIIVK